MLLSKAGRVPDGVQCAARRSDVGRA